MRRRRPIIIPSDGGTRVHPFYVADAAEAFVYMLGRPDRIGQTFNLAGNEILTHDQYFASIARALGVPLVAEHIPGEWLDRQGMVPKSSDDDLEETVLRQWRKNT